ncbi:Hpt domain-containing protein [Sunxiuqinia elliptica]|uniref:HPt (Histidine-containing phosphotransfer) domain-containing protein n=1 Tax=Sunxiuqinia elliptica TaxID=655355 RepID=A0A1I2I249_9BACT|nr:Hpt domain-containing protein [Sunxiuqinia elliptica]SFF36455.1 HPt (histidine-containing phosphotransfer) domain-containing protein [Sunxiuqinia elliptica]
MPEKNYTNLDYLKEITGDEDEILKEFILMFFDQLPEFKNGLHDHLENKRYKELGELAHKAKSSVMTFGMEDLGWKLKDLQLKTQKLEAIETYPDFLKEFDEVIAHAEKELQEVLETL